MLAGPGLLLARARDILLGWRDDSLGRGLTGLGLGLGLVGKCLDELEEVGTTLALLGLQLLGQLVVLIDLGGIVALGIDIAARRVRTGGGLGGVDENAVAVICIGFLQHQIVGHIRRK